MSLFAKMHRSAVVGAIVGLAGCADRVPPTAAATAGPPALSAAPDRFITNGSVRIRYREIGQGRPVVLLHGYTDRLEMWAGVADSLALDRRVIVPDVRGFGASDKPTGPAAYGAAMTRDVVALLDALGIAQVDLVGYSMGALISTDLAVRHPTRVRSVVLVAGPFFPDSAGLANMVAPYLADLERGRGLLGFFRWIVPTLPDSILAPLADELLVANDRRALIESLRAMGQLVRDSSAVAGLDIPAVAVVGRTDPLLPYSRRLGRVWKGLKLVELAEADHAVVFAAPEVVAEARAIAR